MRLAFVTHTVAGRAAGALHSSFLHAESMKCCARVVIMRSRKSGYRDYLG
jgi:hypothetical protein